MYEKFFELLKESGKTVAQVCRETGIPESTMSMWKSRYEKGSQTALKYEAMCKIAKCLGVPEGIFFEETGPEKANESSKQESS